MKRVADFKEEIAAKMREPGARLAKSSHPCTVRTPEDIGYYPPNDPREAAKIDAATAAVDCRAAILEAEQLQEERLISYAREVLRILEATKEWSSDTLTLIGGLAVDRGLAGADEQGNFVTLEAE